MIDVARIPTLKWISFMLVDRLENGFLILDAICDVQLCGTKLKCLSLVGKKKIISILKCRERLSPLHFK